MRSRASSIALLAVVAGLATCGGLDPGEGEPCEPELCGTRGKADTAGVPVLMYHDVLAETEVSSDVAVADFVAQLRSLASAGFTAITVAQLVDHLEHGASLPARPILLSFDDGYAGNCSFVPPVLRALGLRAVYFVHTDYVGVASGRGHCSWDQLRALEAEGIVEVHSHTASHPKLPTLSGSALAKELAGSRATLEVNLGHPVRYLAYPYGAADAKVVAAAKAAGYRAAFVIEGRRARRGDGLLRIPRIGVGAGLSLASFRAAVGCSIPAEAGWRDAIDDGDLARFSASPGWQRSAWSGVFGGASHVLPRASAGWASWLLDPPRAGRYEIFALLPGGPDRNGRALYRLRASKNAPPVELRVDQRIAGRRSLGSWELTATAWLSLDSSGGDGVTIADVVVLQAR